MKINIEAGRLPLHAGGKCSDQPPGGSRKASEGAAQPQGLSLSGLVSRHGVRQAPRGTEKGKNSTHVDSTLVSGEGLDCWSRNWLDPRK